MNTLTFTVSKLKSILTGLSKLIARRSTLPILECLRLTRDAEGYVTLCTTDLDAWLLYRFPQTIEGPVCDAVMPFEPLNRALRSNKGQISLLLESKEVIIRTFIGQTSIDHRCELKPVEEWPPLPPITALPVPITADAIKAIREAMDFASDDTSRIVLNSVCLDVSHKDAHYVVGTNGRALYSANSFKFALKEPVSIPTHKFWMWNGLPMENCALTVQPHSDNNQEGWLKFQFTDWTFITKQQVGNYPNWRQVVPQDFNITLEFNEEAVAAVLLAVPQLPGSDDKDKPVTLRNTKTQVFVENGSTCIPIAGVAIKGKPLSIRLNREFLLLCFKTGLTTIHLIDELSPLVFTKDGKRAVVMPLRGADTTPPTPEPENPPATEEPAQPKEETTSMPAESKTATTPPTPIIEDVLNRVVTLKDNLKDFLRDLQEVYALLKQVEREKKATDKEIESVRAMLREIQSVKI